MSLQEATEDIESVLRQQMRMDFHDDRSDIPEMLTEAGKGSRFRAFDVHLEQIDALKPFGSPKYRPLY